MTAATKAEATALPGWRLRDLTPHFAFWLNATHITAALGKEGAVT